MLCVVSEDTERVIGERRMATLRDLGSDLSVVRTEQETLEFAGRQLDLNRRDLPFTLTYLFDDDGATARLAASTGIAGRAPGRPGRGHGRGPGPGVAGRGARCAASRRWCDLGEHPVRRPASRGVERAAPCRRWSRRCPGRAAPRTGSWSPP